MACSSKRLMKRPRKGRGNLGEIMVEGRFSSYLFRSEDVESTIMWKYDKEMTKRNALIEKI